MHIFRLLAARRRPVSTITAAAAAPASLSDAGRDSEDEGPFFDLDFSSVRGASSSSGSQSGSDDDDDSTDLDFIISLHRSRSASPSYDTLFFAATAAAPLKFCASEPSSKATFQPSHQFCAKRAGGGGLRTLSFGAKKAAFYGGRHSFARSSCSARSLRLFMESPADDVEEVAEPRQAPPSRDLIRRYLTKISRRFRRTAPRAAGEARGLRRLRKSRSASAATSLSAPSLAAPPSRRDDSLLEKQDGIASAIAHCKESLHRASVSECDSSLSRSRSDPGKREADHEGY
uniref:Membrane-associated kinase regulator n=1 Tax=Oryza punctata TaxID=4537 RepID=A0A0E0L694_ORYPU